MSKYLVIAGNRDQFREFIGRKAKQIWEEGHTSVTLSDFLYVGGPDQLRGYSNPQGFFIGTWKERIDLEDIFMILSTVITDSTKRDNLRDIYSKWKAHQK